MLRGFRAKEEQGILDGEQGRPSFGTGIGLPCFGVGYRSRKAFVNSRELSAWPDHYRPRLNECVSNHSSD